MIVVDFFSNRSIMQHETIDARKNPRRNASGRMNGLAGFEQGTSSNEVSPCRDNDLTKSGDPPPDAFGAESGAAWHCTDAQAALADSLLRLSQASPEDIQLTLNSLTERQQAELMRSIRTLLARR